MIFFQKRMEGKAPQPPTSDLDVLRQRTQSEDLPAHAKEAAQRELDRLAKTEPSAAEYSVGLGYLDFLLGLPWGTGTQDCLDIERAGGVLSGGHYGLGQGEGTRARIPGFQGASGLVRLSYSGGGRRRDSPDQPLRTY